MKRLSCVWGMVLGAITMVGCQSHQMDRETAATRTTRCVHQASGTTAGLSTGWMQWEIFSKSFVQRWGEVEFEDKGVLSEEWTAQETPPYGHPYSKNVYSGVHMKVYASRYDEDANEYVKADLLADLKNVTCTYSHVRGD